MGSEADKKSRAAILELALEMNKVKNDVNYGFIQFAENVSNGQAFHSNIESSWFKGQETGASNIRKAFKKANELLKKADLLSNKYVIVLGDGRYWYKDDLTDANEYWNKSNGELKKLKAINNLKLYGVRYMSGSKNNWTVSNGDRGGSEYFCDNGQKFQTCDINNMKQIVSSQDLYYEVTNDNYQEIFQKIKDEIIKNEQINAVLVAGEIIDNIGNKFSIVDEGGISKTINIKQITKNYAKVLENNFEIAIDPSSNGWNSTNSGFSLTYNKDKSIKSNDNPEVYWEPENKDLQSCSDGATIKDISNISTSKYYTVTCEQGYDTLEGFQANLNINTLNKGTKYFKINYATGFPINLVMSNNIRCTYHFDIESFNDDYQKELNEFNTNSPADVQTRKVINSNYNKIVEGYKLLYSDSNDNSLNKYAETFYKSNPKVILKYKSSEIEEFDLVRTDNENNRAICNSGINETVNGVSIINDRVCTLSVSKAMQFPLMCINASKPIPEICVKNTNQLVGGNLLYPSIKEKGGYISVNINNADIFGRSVLLEGDKVDKDASTGRCEFDVMSNPDNSGKKFYYRQIDVSDPFVQKFQIISIF